MVQADVDRINYNRQFGATWVLFEARPLQTSLVELPGLAQLRLSRAIEEYETRATEFVYPIGENQFWVMTYRPELLFEIFTREKIQYKFLQFAGVGREEMLPDRGTGNPSLEGAKKRLKGAAWILGIALFGYWVFKDKRTRKADNWVYID